MSETDPEESPTRPTAWFRVNRRRRFTGTAVSQHVGTVNIVERGQLQLEDAGTKNLR